MDLRPTRIFSLGENAVTVEFGNTVSEAFNEAAINLAEHFTECPFPGFVEAVPAMASTTIFYRCFDLRSSTQGLSAFEYVRNLITEAVDSLPQRESKHQNIIDVPISISDEVSLDLRSISSSVELTSGEVVEIFLASIYRVYMLGFLPGFAYMGKVDERIAVPRHPTPRLAVPKGSVGIAGRQTGIYPAESPGGWQIIGRTALEVITYGETSPCIFAPGDRVRFVRA